LDFIIEKKDNTGYLVIICQLFSYWALPGL